jgi:hypothetical protein
MIFDTDQQKQLILEMLKAVQFPGTALDAIYQLKQDVLKADVTSPTVTAFNEALR